MLHERPDKLKRLAPTTRNATGDSSPGRSAAMPCHRDNPTAASEFVPDGFAPSTEDIRTGLLEQAHKRLDVIGTDGRTGWRIC